MGLVSGDFVFNVAVAGAEYWHDLREYVALPHWVTFAFEKYLIRVILFGPYSSSNLRKNTCLLRASGFPVTSVICALREIQGA